MFKKLLKAMDNRISIMAGYRKYKPKAKRAPRKYSKKTTKKTTKVSPKLTQAIKSVMMKTAEHKSQCYNALIQFGNVIQSTVMNVQNISPNSVTLPLVGGYGSADRIGNKIKTVKALLRYVIFPLPYNAGSNPAPCPQDVIIYIGHLKKGIQSPTSTDFLNLYNDGNTVNIPFGNLEDLINPINKDYFVVSKIIRHKVGYALASGTGLQAANQYYPNNDYKLNVIRTVDVTKCLAASYDFNDANNTPQNSQTYMWMQAISSDGLTAPATRIPTAISYTIDYQYVDL